MPVAIHLAGVATYANGSTDDYSNIAAALTAQASTGGDVWLTGGQYKTSATLTIPAGVNLLMAQNAVLKPSGDFNVVRLKATAGFRGKIDTSAVTFTSVVLDMDGDDYATTGFLLERKTWFDAVIYGSTGSGTGTAIKVHADGITGARVMGVDGKARIYGFEYGLWMRQTSLDSSKFITGCYFDISGAYTLKALYMESSNVNGYDVDANYIRYQTQPLPGTTVPAFTLCGQQNTCELTPFDWNGVAGTAPIAVVIGAGVRRSNITIHQDPAYTQNDSIARENILIHTFEGDGLSLGQLLCSATDGVLRLLGADLRLDNGQALKLVSSGGTDGPVITTAGDDVLIQSLNVSGSDLAYDVVQSAAGHFWRIAGTNKVFLTSSKWTSLVPVEVTPGASVTPSSNGSVVMELTSNTALTFKAKGSDGTVRSGVVTLS